MPAYLVKSLRLALICSAALLGVATAPADVPWATQMIAYNPGSNPEPGYQNPNVVLGEPARFTGANIWPGAVTPFNPPWTADEILSIGAGGSLTVAFDRPLTNDPDHLFGVDLIIFGNGGFIDDAWPGGVVGGLLQDGPFSVSVSADGVNFVALPELHYDAMFPMLGYSDLTNPYATEPGAVLADFTKPVDPSLSYDDFFGNTFSDIVALYSGSGGGIPIDIASSGLSAVHYVRIDVLAGASSVEIDAFALVPEPTTLPIALLVLGVLRRKRL